MPVVLVPTAKAVIQADNERRDLALCLAYDQLGIPPCRHKQPAAFNAYQERLQITAREIFARLN